MHSKTAKFKNTKFENSRTPKEIVNNSVIGEFIEFLECMCNLIKKLNQEI